MMARKTQDNDTKLSDYDTKLAEFTQYVFINLIKNNDWISLLDIQDKLYSLVVKSIKHLLGDFCLCLASFDDPISFNTLRTAWGFNKIINNLASTIDMKRKFAEHPYYFCSPNSKHIAQLLNVLKHHIAIVLALDDFDFTHLNELDLEIAQRKKEIEWYDNNLNSIKEKFSAEIKMEMICFIPASRVCYNLPYGKSLKKLLPKETQLNSFIENYQRAQQFVIDHLSNKTIIQQKETFRFVIKDIINFINSKLPKPKPPRILTNESSLSVDLPTYGNTEILIGNNQESAINTLLSIFSKLKVTTKSKVTISRCPEDISSINLQFSKFVIKITIPNGKEEQAAQFLILLSQALKKKNKNSQQDAVTIQCLADNRNCFLHSKSQLKIANEKPPTEIAQSCQQDRGQIAPISFPTSQNFS